MNIDRATRWSLGLWLLFGLLPTILWSLPWAVWVKDEKLAAWVQAIGSILAVVATAGAVLFQQWIVRRAEAVRTFAEVLQRVNSARRLIAASRVIAEKVMRYSRDSLGIHANDRILMVSELNAVADHLLKVDVGAFVNWRHVECVTVSLAVTRALSDMLYRASDPRSSDLKEIFDALDQREKLLGSHLQHVGFTDF